MIRRSQASASARPPPAAAPGSDAIVGLGIVNSLPDVARWLIRWRWIAPSIVLSPTVPSPLAAMALTSPPPQNAPPAPVSTMHRTAGSSSARGERVGEGGRHRPGHRVARLGSVHRQRQHAVVQRRRAARSCRSRSVSPCALASVLVVRAVVHRCGYAATRPTRREPSVPDPSRRRRNAAERAHETDRSVGVARGRRRGQHRGRRHSTASDEEGDVRVEGSVTTISWVPAEAVERDAKSRAPAGDVARRRRATGRPRPGHRCHARRAGRPVPLRQPPLGLRRVRRRR